MTGEVRLAGENGIGGLTFDHPRRLNAITAAMRPSLPDMLEPFDTYPAIRALPSGRAGDRAF